MPDLSPDDPIASELKEAIAGRYTLEHELGRGGMGAVFLARDLKLDRLVAIKVLPPEQALRPELRERFLRETRTAAGFSHPNIVSVHSVEEMGNLLFFVMSYVEGTTLSQKVRRQGPLPVPDAVRLIQEVAWALSYAHARGVVHRDVKPDNILIERSTGRALVLDFGIARSTTTSSLTQIGETVGTPHFMSPEQAAGDKVDGRSDLYSLGVVAYFAMTGRLPFDAESGQATMVAHISQPAPPVSRFRPDLPLPLTTAVDRLLAKAPEDRFPTGEALVEALEQVNSRRIEIPPPIRVWTARSDQFFRNGILLALLMPQLVRSGSELAQLVTAALFCVVVIPALWAQIPLGMRELARQGFGFRELKGGIRAIDEERVAVITAQRADPRFARRRRRTWLLLLSGFAVSGLTIYLSLASGHQESPGHFKVAPPALVALFFGLCLGMACIVFGAATLSSGGRMDRRLHALWTGKVGAALFRLASWHLAHLPDTGMALPSRHGPTTLLEGLQGDAKRRLSKVRVALERLEGEVERLERREQELASAMVEAKAHEATLPAAVSGRQQALLDDLDRARRAAVERRVAILGGLENVRLALVRVKTRLGTPEDVERELAAASGVLRDPE